MLGVSMRTCRQQQRAARSGPAATHVKPEAAEPRAPGPTALFPVSLNTMLPLGPMIIYGRRGGRQL